MDTEPRADLTDRDATVARIMERFGPDLDRLAAHDLGETISSGSTVPREDVAAVVDDVLQTGTRAGLDAAAAELTALIVRHGGKDATVGRQATALAHLVAMSDVVQREFTVDLVHSLLPGAARG